MNHTTNTTTVSISQMANMLGVQRQAIYTWFNRGCPRLADGRVDPAAVTAWRETDLARQAADNGDGDALDLKAEQARKTKAQADLAELELKRRRHELVELAEVTASNEAKFAAVRRAMISVARRLPMLLEGQPRPEMARICESEVREALNRLANGTDSEPEGAA